MMNKQILRSIASITKRVGGDLASPIIDKITPAETKTLTGEVIVAEGTMDSFSGDVIIEGSTLQNIMPDLNDQNYIKSPSVEIVNSKEYVFNAVPPGNHVHIGPKLEMIPIHYNTTYTLMTEYSYINTEVFEYIKYSNGYTGIVVGSENRLNNSLDYLLYTITTETNKPDNAIMSFRCVGVSATPGIDGSVTFKNMMCVAGDHTNKQPMQYFKNVHSLGESGKIYLKSSNKNIFPVSNNFKNGDLRATFPSETKIEYINGNAVITKLTNSAARHVVFEPKVFLRKGVKYYVAVDMESSDNSNQYVAIRNANAVFDFRSGDTKDNIKRLEFVANKTGYFNIAITTTDLAINETITIKSCYFGTCPMGDDFVYHEENIVEIPVKEPVRSIDTIGVCDRIVKKGNRYYVERNIGKYEVNIDTVDSWIPHVLENDSSTIAFKNESLMGIAVEGLVDTNIYCVSSFLAGNSHWRIYRENEIPDTGISLSQSSRLYIRILKNTVLPNDTLDGFKEYVRNNPFYILYPLKEPVYEELDIEDIQVELYPEISVISAYDECIHGNTTIDVPMNIMSIISNDIRKINSLEKEITKAEKTVLTETMNLISIDEQFNNHIQKL